MKRIVIVCLLIFIGLNVFSETYTIPSRYLSKLNIKTNVQGLRIANTGNEEYDYLQVRFLKISSKKYITEMIPVLLITIERDDPKIDINRVLQVYMSKLLESYNAQGSDLAINVEKIHGFSDQITSLYQYEKDNKNYIGLLFVGNKKGNLVVAYSAVIEDLIEEHILKMIDILNGLEWQ
jgi:hypothetical protein